MPDIKNFIHFFFIKQKNRVQQEHLGINAVNAVQCRKFCRYRLSASVNLYTKHENEDKLWSRRVWLGHGCWHQTGGFEWLQNCWPEIFTHNHLWCLHRMGWRTSSPETPCWWESSEENDQTGSSLQTPRAAVTQITSEQKSTSGHTTWQTLTQVVYSRSPHWSFTLVSWVSFLSGENTHLAPWEMKLIHFSFKTAFWNKNNLCPEKHQKSSTSILEHLECTSHDHSGVPDMHMPVGSCLASCALRQNVICITAARQNNKVSKTCNPLSMPHSPLVVETDAVCLLLEKGRMIAAWRLGEGFVVNHAANTWLRYHFQNCISGRQDKEWFQTDTRLKAYRNLPAAQKHWSSMGKETTNIHQIPFVIFSGLILLPFLRLYVCDFISINKVTWYNSL